jgi:hypothetical protein
VVQFRDDQCGWGKCRRGDICCLVPHPNDVTLLCPLCDDHFGKWHETQGEPRKALVLRLFGKPVRDPKQPRQGGLFHGTQGSDNDRSTDD